MKQKITIPYNLLQIQDSDEFIIDMSNLKFEFPITKQKLCSFIFLRNTAINAELDFSNCSYEDKEEFLLMFLKEKITIQCKILALTWIEILSFNGNDPVNDSILTKDEIKIFIDKNCNFCDHVHQFINSLPLYAISCCKLDEKPADISEFEVNDYNEISVSNFYQLAEMEDFLLLVESNPPENHRPVFFEKIFKDPQNEYEMSTIMLKLPFINMVMAIFAPPEVQVDIINGINNFLTDKKEE